MKASVNFAILSIIAFATAVICTLAGISYFTHQERDVLQKQLLQVEKLYVAVDDIEIQFLMARRAEKDLLIRRNEKYVGRHAEAMEKLYIALATAQELAPVVEKKSDAQFDFTALTTSINAYEQGFAKLVTNKMALGLDEKSGLQGELRSAVHNVEEQLKTIGQPEMQVKMLMMRRHEKDFIMRQTPKYLDRLNARVDEFRQFPDSYYQNADQKKTILDLLTAYQAAFGNLVTGTLEELETQKQLSEQYAVAEPILQELHASAKTVLEDVTAQTQVTSTQAKQNSLRASIGGSVIFVIVALLLARSISRPLAKISVALKGMRSGDFSRPVPKSKLSEIAAISSAVTSFQSDEEKKDQLMKDISVVIQACAEGDFSQRLNTEGDTGSFVELSRGMNAIGEAAQSGLGDVLTALDALAGGDLTRRMPAGQQGIFLEISDALDNLNGSLGGMVKQLSASSQLLNSTSNEIAAAVDDASRRGESSAASIEETSAALQTISDTVRSTAESSQETKGFVDNAQNRATSSREVAQQTADAMKRIEESSGAIAKITGLIEDVAFQTSLLALNAGVEAARAGEAGRGFAVVASEVRALAHRSAAAAQEIKDLISTSEKEVAAGVKLVSETGASLDSILDTIEQVVGKVNEIAENTVEQSTGLSEVNIAVGTLDRDAQQNAAMLEETAAAGQILRTEAANLAQAISGFRIDNSGPSGLSEMQQDSDFGRAA